MAAFWQNVRLVWTRADGSWIVLWIGLALLIVAFIVLVRTRWGQSQPLGKCALLSLLAHLLLAVYATTIQIVVATSNSGAGDSTRVTLVDGDEPDDANDSDPALAHATSHSADARVFASVDVPQPARLDIEKPKLTPAAADPLSSELDNRRSPAAELAALAPPPALPKSQPLSGRPPAAVLENVKPESRTEPASGVPEVASPQRMALVDRAGDRSSASGALDGSREDGQAGSTQDRIADFAGEVQLKTADESPFRRGAVQPLAASPASTLDETGSATGPGGHSGSPLLVPVKDRNDTASLPPIYQDRVADDHEAVARRRGGSAETEAAVQAALAWLAANQSLDGRWDADRFGAGQERSVLGQDRGGAGARADTATTGLSLLAFLGAGHTHLAGKYKDNVKRGLEHLLNSQAQDGNLGGDAELFAFMYSHGIATLALSEAYAMTGDKRLEKGVRAAIGYTLAAQNPSTGGWRYRVWSSSPSDAGDTSQLGWQLMALKSAELSGITIPDDARKGMIRFLTSVSSGNQGGLAAYRARERVTRPMTAEALVCRQFLGMARDNPAANEAGNYLLGELPDGNRVNLYYWYYGTLAMYQLQGEHWRKWNGALQEAIVEQQVMAGPNAGSWNPDCVWAGYGGRVYSTAMAALSLEVYYRYLPLYGELGPVLREAKRAQPR